MFEALLRLLTGAEDGQEIAERNDPAFALAVLLIEVARMDDGIDRRERGIIERVLERCFGLDRTEAARLIRAAEEGASRATDLYAFTQVVVRSFSEQERAAVIEMLWEVAYSDGSLTGDEDMLIRRVAGLIYVPDRERGAARQRALKRLQAQ